MSTLGKLWAIGLLVAIGAVTIALAPPPTMPRQGLPASIAAPHGVLPLAMHHAGHSTVAAYAAAQQAPEVLSAVPCTCGCAALGHRNNLDCYIERRYADGSALYTTHGVACAVCQEITRDAMAGAAAGLGPAELHQMIVAKYGPHQ